jgi:hypothetical protein
MFSMKSDDGALTGDIEFCIPFDTGSYIARIFYKRECIARVVYGDGVSAEDWLLEKLEFPEWTILKA